MHRRGFVAALVAALFGRKISLTPSQWWKAQNSIVPRQEVALEILEILRSNLILSPIVARNYEKYLEVESPVGSDISARRGCIHA